MWVCVITLMDFSQMGGTQIMVLTPWELLDILFPILTDSPGERVTGLDAKFMQKNNIYRYHWISCVVL